MTATLPDYDEALARALHGIEPLEWKELAPLDVAHGRVLREQVVADRDIPPFNRAQMDGYALRAAEFNSVESWPVAATISAGMPADAAIAPGHCAAIATGAPLPSDVDTVIQHELSDRGNPVRFSIDAIEPGHAVHPRGADARAGDVLIDVGVVLGSQHLGIAATVGLSRIVVARKPRVTVLTSGDEVLPIDDPVRDHQIRNTNGVMLLSLVQHIGAELLGCRHLLDEESITVTAVGEALGESDIVITVGGISAGDRDFFPAAFKTHGIQPQLCSAAIQPGRPIFVGRDPQGAIVVGLPGNPVSSLACCCLFVWPIVRALLGAPIELPWRDVQLSDPVKPNSKRRAFRPAIIAESGAARVPSWAGSGDLVHTGATHGLVELPVQSGEVQAGATLRFLPWP